MFPPSLIMFMLQNASSRSRPREEESKDWLRVPNYVPDPPRHKAWWERHPLLTALLFLFGIIAIPALIVAVLWHFRIY